MVRKFVLFRRRKLTYLLITLSIPLLIIIHQLVMFVQISNINNKSSGIQNLIRGIHPQQEKFYIPKKDGKFVCIRSLEEIDFNKVNDNYCDCLDGSDEPGTNACSNGIFYCAMQVDTKHFVKSVESPKVNDGICDCCDGSDEWAHNQVIKNFDRASQSKSNTYHVPCPKMC